MKNTTILFFCFSLGGCLATNPFTKFYEANPYIGSVLNNPNFVITNEDPKIFSGTTYEKDSRALRENGYIQIGHSSFNGPASDQNAVLQQAKHIHAEIAIFYSQYQNTVSGAMPWVSPTTQISSTNFSGNFSDKSGITNYTGNARTITQRSTTTYIPYNIHLYSQTATFWAKIKPPIFGVQMKELTDETRKEIKSNKGAYIDIVIKGTPAFFYDFFSGDIIKKIGEKEIYDVKSAQSAFAYYAGLKVPVHIWRAGELITKEVILNKN